MPLLVSDITPLSAAKLNDASQLTYTDNVLLPFVKMAWEELKLELVLTGNLRVMERSSILVLPIGQTDLVDAGIQPSGMLEPLRLWERLNGSSDNFLPMRRLQWEPQIQATDSLRYWDYRKQHIITVGATTTRDVQIDYLEALIDITSTGDTLDVNHCKMFMIFKTASFAAYDVGSNKTRGDSLDGKAGYYLSKLRRINTKSKQGVRSRRKPHRVRKMTNYTS